MTDDASSKAILSQATTTVEDDGTPLSALMRLLDCLDEDTADCIDNAGRRYQSQALADRIRRAREIVSPRRPATLTTPARCRPIR